MESLKEWGHRTPIDPNESLHLKALIRSGSDAILISPISTQASINSYRKWTGALEEWVTHIKKGTFSAGDTKRNESIWLGQL